MRSSDLSRDLKYAVLPMRVYEEVLASLEASPDTTTRVMEMARQPLDDTWVLRGQDVFAAAILHAGAGLVLTTLEVETATKGACYSTADRVAVRRYAEDMTRVALEWQRRGSNRRIPD